MIFVLVLALLVFLPQHAMARNQSLLVLEHSPNDDLNKMLLLTDGWPNKDPSWTNQTPACQWANVSCTNGIVTELDWKSRGLEGFFNGSNLPTGLKYGYFDSNKFEGSPILTSLPVALLMLTLGGNLFIGTPDLGSLPGTLQVLHLNYNQFTGNPKLKSLPANLLEMLLGNNAFSGTPDLSSLPANLQSLDLSGSDFSPRFSGTPDLGTLPANMQYLDLRQNNFCGSTEVDISCQYLYVGGESSCDDNTHTVTFKHACDTMP